MTQQPAAAVAAADSKLIGIPPAIFDGDRTKSEQFIHDFTIYRAFNFDHRIMRSPYLRILLALQYIKGPLVQDWANDYVTEMNGRINHPTNPVPENRAIQSCHLFDTYFLLNRFLLSNENK